MRGDDMCIHDRHYEDEYGYLSSLFDKWVYFSRNSALQLRNISSEEKSLCIFNKYSAKRAVFDCILNSYIVKKTVLQTGRYYWTK